MHDGRRLIQAAVQVVARVVHLVGQNRLVSRVREQQRLQAPVARVLSLQRRELLHDAHVVLGALTVDSNSRTCAPIANCNTVLGSMSCSKISI